MKKLHIVVFICLNLFSCTNSIYYATTNTPLIVFEKEDRSRKLATIPTSNSFKIQKKSGFTKKGCWYVYSKDTYIGIICNPKFIYFGKTIPQNFELYNDYVSVYTLELPINSLAGSSETYSNTTIHTGPKGGKYYINSHGNKTYLSSQKKYTRSYKSSKTYRKR